MGDCPLLTRCPVANDKDHDLSEMREVDKQRYCTEDYAWCGRYMAFEVLQRELERDKPSDDQFRRQEA